MPRRDWRLRVEDIVESVELIALYTSGMNFDAFAGDQRTVDAVAYRFIVIGEAARHVPPELETRHPDVPWVEMRGMRNVVAHEYFGLALEIVWRTVETRLPPLLPHLRRVLEETER